MKAVVAAFNQEKALVGAFSVITNLRMELFQALFLTTICPLLAALTAMLASLCDPGLPSATAAVMVTAAARPTRY